MSMNQSHPDADLSGLNIDVMHFGLEAITRLLSRFGHPQKDVPAVHIAGTNGKGSTAAMTASILSRAGYRVGLYTSPHLVDVRERIVVNGRKIPRRVFHGILAEIKKRTDQPVTYFEVLTAVAFIYFQRQKVDLAVLEAGLGGRLDATNVCHPLVSVVTNISLEHAAYLGKTLTAIAGEKGGIIKRNGVCLTAARPKKVLDVLADICRKRHARLFRLGADFRVRVGRNGQLSYKGIKGEMKGLALSLIGRYQRENAALSLAVVEILNQKGYRIGEEAVRRGLLQTRWEARFEILKTRPLFVLDGAHNPAGLAALERALDRAFSGRRRIFIFSVLADKDYRRMLYRLGPQASRILLPPIHTKRAVAPKVLADILGEKGWPSLVCRSVKDAVAKALHAAGEKDLICACGSLYLAGEIKQLFPEIICCDKKPAL